MSEVKAGFECGLSLKNYNDIKEGDQLEVFEVVEVARTLRRVDGRRRYVCPRAPPARRRPDPARTRGNHPHEVKDPRVGMITLTDVEVNRDIAHAKVYFTTLGGEAEHAETCLQGLQRAGGFLRTQLVAPHQLRIGAASCIS